MYAQPKPRYHPIAIPEVSLESYPKPEAYPGPETIRLRDGHLVQIPGLESALRGVRSSKTCHTPMDWTGYWVDRMGKELALHDLPAAKRKKHASALQDFLTANPGAPSKHGPEVIGAYLSEYEAKRGLEASTGNLASTVNGAYNANQILTALLFFYEHVLKAPKCLAGIPRGQEAGKENPLAGLGQVKGLIQGMADEKHRLLFSLTHGFGLSISELLKVKLADIDFARGSLAIRSGIHKSSARPTQDRIVLIPHSLLAAIQAYRNRAVPVVYLFESGRAGKPLAKRAVERFFAAALEKARIRERGGLPSYGTDLRFVQAYLGHGRAAGKS